MKTVEIHGFKPNVPLRGPSKGKDFSPILFGLLAGMVLIYFSYGVIMSVYDHYTLATAIKLWYNQ